MKAMVKILAVVLALGFSAAHAASPAVGAPAPDFSLKGADGKTYRLSDFKGKPVVLEWFNNECPYVKKHYDSGNMQALQKKHTVDGAVWLTVLSSAPGSQGYLTAEEAKKLVEQRKSNATAFLLDPDGKVGKDLYDARTTPHMYVIDKVGNLVYKGAIDDQPSANPKTLEKAKNYVTAAMTDIKEGRTVATATSEPYGCSVKYQ